MPPALIRMRQTCKSAAGTPSLGSTAAERHKLKRKLKWQQRRDREREESGAFRGQRASSASRSVPAHSSSSQSNTRSATGGQRSTRCCIIQKRAVWLFLLCFSTYQYIATLWFGLRLWLYSIHFIVPLTANRTGSSEEFRCCYSEEIIFQLDFTCCKLSSFV